MPRKGSKSLETLVSPTPVSTHSQEDQEAVRQLLPELPDYIDRLLDKLKPDIDIQKGKFRPLLAAEKQAICVIYRRTASVDKTCDRVGISPTMLYRHLELDPDFREAFTLAKFSIGDKIQAMSVKRALDPQGVVDRMCQLKRFFPRVYRESQSQVNIGVSVNLAPNHP